MQGASRILVDGIAVREVLLPQDLLSDVEDRMGNQFSGMALSLEFLLSACGVASRLS